MRKFWTLLCAALLCLWVLPAAAAPGDAAFFAADPVSGEREHYISSTAICGEALYALGDGLYVCRPGQSEPEVLLTGEQLHSSPPEGVAYEDWQEPPTPAYLVSGGDVLHAIARQTGEWGTWDEAKKAFTWDAPLPGWEELILPNQDWVQTKQLRQLKLESGILYAAVERDDEDWQHWDLWRFDLAAGIHDVLPVTNMLAFTPYKPGQLLVTAMPEEPRTLSVTAIDAATGQTLDRLFTQEEADWEGAIPLYDADADAIFLLYAGELRPLSDGALGEEQLYLPTNAMRRPEAAALLAKDLLVLTTWEGIYLRNIDPQYKPAQGLLLMSGWADELVSAFNLAHPETPVRLKEQWGQSSEIIIQDMLAGEGACDLYLVYATRGLKPLKEKGYLADLSGSAKLAANAQALYPWAREAIEMDGGVYGVPSSLSLKLWRVDEGLLETLGLPAPGTYAEMLEMIETWENDFAEDNPSIEFFRKDYDRVALLNDAIEAYILAHEQPGQPLSLNSPDFIELMRGIEASPLPQIDWETVRSMTFSSEDKVLFEQLYAPFERNYASNDSHSRRVLHPPLALTPGEQAPIRGDLSVYVLNPNSPNKELAIQFLEFVAEHLPPETQYALQPGLNEPVKDEQHAKWEAEAVQQVAEAEQYLAEAEEGTARLEAEDSLKMAREYLANTRRNVWKISAEAIAMYRALGERITLGYGSSIIGQEVERDIYTVVDRYMAGEQALEPALRELDKKLRMVFLEGE